MTPAVRESPGQLVQPWQRYVWWVIVGAALLVRLPPLGSPVDGTFGDPWREGDVAGIARNFYAEDMQLLHPRIDWRGDGPGLVEMEFPIYPWLVAATYHVVGYHEQVARVYSLLFSMGAILVFWALASSLLAPAGALAALGFFAFNPLVARLGWAVQPDGLMLLAYVSAVFCFLRWVEEDTWRWWVASASAIALAVLAKASAAHLGLVFVGLLWLRGGWRAFAAPRVWALGIVSIAPGIAWHMYARQFWTEYGNSLGLSSEHHWISPDLLLDPGFLARIAGLDLLYAWLPIGGLLGAFGLLGTSRSRVAWQLAALWMVGVFIYLVAAGRTTSESWAIHYHTVAVPPAALLVGLGVQRIAGWRRRWWPVAFAACAAAGGVVFGATGVVAASGGLRMTLVTGAVGFLLAAAIATGIVVGRVRADSVGAPAALLLALVPAAVVQGPAIAQDLTPSQWPCTRACAQQFATHIPPDALIIVPGGSCYGATGQPVSYQAPFIFFWADRDGFSICLEEQSQQTVEELAVRGATFYIANPDAMAFNPEFAQWLTSRYRVADRCDGWIVVALE